MTEPASYPGMRYWNWVPPPFTMPPPPVNGDESDNEPDIPPIAGYGIELEESSPPISK